MDGGIPVSISYDFLLTGGRSDSFGTSDLSVAIRIEYRSWSGLHSAITCGLVALVGSKLEMLLAMLMICNKKQVIFIPKISFRVKGPAREAYSLGKARGKEQWIDSLRGQKFTLLSYSTRIYSTRRAAEDLPSMGLHLRAFWLCRYTNNINNMISIIMT